MTGLLGLLVGGLIGYLVGHSGESTKTVANGPAVTHTVTSTKTVPGPTKVETVTQKTVTQAPPSPEAERKLEEAEEKVSKLERENEEQRKGETP